MSILGNPLRSRLVLLALLATVVVTIGWSGVADAHTDFESSTPSDREAVDGPLDEVVVRFTNPAEPAGEGFELLDPSGAVRSPTSVDATDGTAFVLRFAPPLEAGEYGLRWMVRAGDAHPIDGAFRFEVAAPAAPPTTVADAGSTGPAAATVTPSTTPAAPGAESGTALDEFLTAETGGDDARAVGRLGRSLTFIGTIFGVGALAALVWVIRGHRDELHTQLTWIRLAGLVIAAGGVAELAALEAAQSTELVQLLDSKAGLAALLKVVGGTAVCLGFHGRAGRVVAPARSLSAAVMTDLRPGTEAAVDPGDEHRWSPTASAVAGFAGFALVLGSFWFDGHTVSKGPWAIHSLVNLVHIGAASVWGGGVFAMTTVAWLRRRRAARVGLAAMVIRFSTLATVSLAAVVVAGLVMTAFILETPGDLVSTEWGRLLIAKLGAVGVAMTMGAYNHLKLRPALERDPGDPRLAERLRLSLTVESVVFVVVVVLTALLVASAT